MSKILGSPSNWPAKLEPVFYAKPGNPRRQDSPFGSRSARARDAVPAERRTRQIRDCRRRAGVQGIEQVEIELEPLGTELKLLACANVQNRDRRPLLVAVRIQVDGDGAQLPEGGATVRIG